MSKIRPSLLTDEHGTPIQETLKPIVSQRMTLSGLPEVRNAVDFTSMIIEVTPTVDCAFEIGDSSVVAKSGESHYLGADITRRFNVGENTRIAAQAFVSGEIGTLFVSELS